MELATSGLLYGLGAVVALAYLRRPADLFWYLLGLAAGLALLVPFAAPLPPLLQLPSNQGALAVALAMGLMLLYKPGPVALMLTAGLCSAAWCGALWPLLGGPVALIVPLAIAAATVLLAQRHAGFSTPWLRQEACLLLLVASLMLGLTPDILDGWASATQLKALGDSAADKQQFSARGALWLSAASVVLGLIYKRWRYR